jgi:hypothetical protein
MRPFPENTAQTAVDGLVGLDTLSGLHNHVAMTSKGATVDIGAWLRELGLVEYEATFRENAINEKVLPNLTAEDLRDMGIGNHIRGQDCSEFPLLGHCHFPRCHHVAEASQSTCG